MEEQSSKIFRNVDKYSTTRQKELIKAIEKINWDTNYNPNEFLELLQDNSESTRKYWALSRMVDGMSYRTIIKLITPGFFKSNLNEKVFSSIFPAARQKSIRFAYRKIYVKL